MEVETRPMFRVCGLSKLRRTEQKKHRLTLGAKVLLGEEIVLRMFDVDLYVRETCKGETSSLSSVLLRCARIPW